MKLSGIGGQAVIEGVMMRNKDRYSVAVRKPDNGIEVIVKTCGSAKNRSKISKLPVIRGVVNFVDALVIGISTLTYSSSFYEDPKEQQPTKADNVAKAVFKEKLDSVIMAATILCSVVLAIALFMVAPYYISRLLSKYIVSQGVLNLIEGLVRVLIFIIYILLISMMSDIKRTFMYHGAEHKCINCIEHGMALTVENVRNSSREHKRCGTSFIFMVMFISVIFFIFIRLPNPVLQVVVRILLVPVIAGISYEVIQWAGKSESKAVMIVSKPGMLLQKLTTKEPDDSMIEVGIRAVEAVFDWKTFLDEYYADVADEDIPEEAYYYEDDYYDDQDEYMAGETKSEEEESGEAKNTGSVEESVSDEEPGSYGEGLTEDEESSDRADMQAMQEDSLEDGYEEVSGGTDEEEAEGEDAAEADTGISEEDLPDEDEEDLFETEDAEIEGDLLEEDVYAADGDLTEEDGAEEDYETPDEGARGDGIEFIDEESVEDEDVGVVVPIFKQRDTEIKKNDKKR